MLDARHGGMSMGTPVATPGVMLPAPRFTSPLPPDGVQGGNLAVHAYSPAVAAPQPVDIMGDGDAMDTAPTAAAPAPAPVPVESPHAPQYAQQQQQVQHQLVAAPQQQQQPQQQSLPQPQQPPMHSAYQAQSYAPHVQQHPQQGGYAVPQSQQPQQHFQQPPPYAYRAPDYPARAPVARRPAPAPKKSSGGGGGRARSRHMSETESEDDSDSSPSRRRRPRQPARASARPRVAEALRPAQRIVTALMKKENADWFSRPVNPELDNAPDYLTVIHEPMDMGTVKRRLEAGFYQDMAGFVYDMELIWRNAMAYNPAAHLVYQVAERLQREFRRLLSQATPAADDASAAVSDGSERQRGRSARRAVPAAAAAGAF
jgi:hypothetical protein